MPYFVEIDKLILRFIWKCRGSTNNLDKDDKTIFKKKNKAVGLILSGFKIYYKTVKSRQCGSGIRTDERSKEQN